MPDTPPEAQLLKELQDATGNIKIMMEDRQGNVLQLNTEENKASLTCKDGTSRGISSLYAGITVGVVLSESLKTRQEGKTVIDSVKLYPLPKQETRGAGKPKASGELQLGELSPLQQACTVLPRSPEQGR